VEQLTLLTFGSLSHKFADAIGIISEWGLPFCNIIV